MPVLLAVGSEHPLTIDVAQLETRIRSLSAPLLPDASNLLALHVLDSDAVRAFTGEGPINSDWSPSVSYGSLRKAYRGEGNEALFDLLEARVPCPPRLVGSDGDIARAVEANWRVLPDFLQIEGELNAAPGAPPGRSIQQALLTTYSAAPGLQSVEMALFDLLRRFPETRDVLLPGMLDHARNPRRLYQLYISHLRATRNQARLDEVLTRARTLFGPAFGAES